LTHFAQVNRAEIGRRLGCQWKGLEEVLLNLIIHLFVEPDTGNVTDEDNALSCSEGSSFPGS
jgi:hypothetical protein